MQKFGLNMHNFLTEGIHFYAMAPSCSPQSGLAVATIHVNKLGCNGHAPELPLMMITPSALLLV